jgi:hypothetical protein
MEFLNSTCWNLEKYVQEKAKDDSSFFFELLRLLNFSYNEFDLVWVTLLRRTREVLCTNEIYKISSRIYLFHHVIQRLEVYKLAQSTHVSIPHNLFGSWTACLWFSRSNFRVSRNRVKMPLITVVPRWTLIAGQQPLPRLFTSSIRTINWLDHTDCCLSHVLCFKRILYWEPTDWACRLFS